MKNICVQLVAVSLAFGTASGFAFLWLGITHNAQSKFYLPTGDLDYIYCIKLFASCFIIGVFAGGGIFVVCRMLLRLFAREDRNILR